MTTSVLIVDSNIPFMISLKQALEGAGDYRVAMAANPRAAEEALKFAAPDVAVADFEMSGMDAMEMIRMLRSVQPDLPIILTPHDELQLERAQFMDVQAVLLKPYTARDLLPRLRDVLYRPDPYDFDDAALFDETDERPPAEALDLARWEDDTGAADEDEFDLDWLEEPHEVAGDALDEQDQYATRVPPENGEPEGAPDVTPPFADVDPDDADALLEWDELDPTATLYDTEVLDDAGVWRTQPTGQADDEPPPRPDDTPYVSAEHDAMSATFDDDLPHGSEVFDDVLDAVANSETTARAPQDREFHDLVDSLRRDEPSRAHRSRLEDLLESLGEDATKDMPAKTGDALDRVLDAIRQGRSPVAEDVRELVDSDLGDDMTIGDVIDGLFDPGFEGVLAALSGAEIDESTIEEPTYEDDLDVAQRAPAEPQPGEPAAYAPGETSDDGPAIAEPPPRDDDSSKYPATTALAAVSSEDGAFSLDDLLSQIEQQLPEVRSDRPRIKPLPSWGREGYLEGASDVVELFDRAEGVRDEAAEHPAGSIALGDSEPLMFQQDKRWREPSRRVKPEFTPREPAESAGDTRPGEPVSATTGAQPADEEAADAALPMDELLAQADVPSEAATEELVQDREQYAPSGAERAAGERLSDEEIAAAFYAGIREQGAYFDDVLAPPDDLLEPPFDIALEDEHLVPLPVDEATQRIEAALDEEEDVEAGQVEAGAAADVAQIAVQLTQYSLESSAQVTLLSREGELLAHAGDADEDTVADLFDAVDHAWTRSNISSESLIRVVELPDGGEFLVYSTRLAGDMTLSMAFHANTSLRLIRRQARRLSESLDLVPDTSGDAGDDIPPAARTLPSRPTNAAPPPGLRGAVAGQELGDLPPRPARDDEPYTAYTALWLPYDPGQELSGELAGSLEDWIRDIAEESAWKLVAMQVHPDYIALTLSAPQKLSPDSVITHLMDRTADRAADEYPDLANGGPLWTDGYYVVTPPRDLTDREIARIVTVQRNAQMER